MTEIAKIELSIGAATDISALAKGTDRVSVALNALQSEDLSTPQIEELIQLAKEYTERRSLPADVTAETILEGYRKFPSGAIQFTLPLGITIQEAGKILNALAKERNFDCPVFCDSDEHLWAHLEANSLYQTHAGITYVFQIPKGSALKTREEQEGEYGRAAPLGAIAIALACHLLENKGLEDPRDNYWNYVRGSAPGFAITSSNDNYNGVTLCVYDDEVKWADDVFAALVSP